MSLYIAGIDLPHKDASPITLMIFHDGSIWHYDDETEFKAIQVPPHGRLGDLDTLKDEDADVHQDIEHCGYVEDTIYGFSREMIDNVLTIIPADKEE